MTKREINEAARAAYERARRLAKQDNTFIDAWEDIEERVREYWRDLQKSAFDAVYL